MWTRILPAAAAVAALACSDDGETPSGAASSVTTVASGGAGAGGASSSGGGGATGGGGNGGATGGGGNGGGAAGSGGAPDGSMSFFATSVGNGTGDYRGLVGADAFCQNLADAAGSDKTWRAYLSTHPNAGPGQLVNAADRIGQGPWYNFSGTLVAADITGLHAGGIAPALILDEQGATIPTQEHDIVTGSQADGTSFATFPGNPNAPPPTCANWTSQSGNDYVWVGHADGGSWNSQHETTCSQQGLMSTAGSGRIYCFAID
jgi:hypothetical protein